jgi:hypothetical protein
MQREILVEEDDIPWIEMRGRTPSKEYLMLRNLRPGKSFVSAKSRDSIYQIAHKADRCIRTSSAGFSGERKLWRIWIDEKKEARRAEQRRLAEEQRLSELEPA